jgi:benzodiazapine receptor
MAFGKSDIIKLIASIIICQLTGIVGSFFTRLSVGTWYATIQKPPFTPPGWLFAPVWTLLYLLMGISFFLIWRKGVAGPVARNAVVLFGLQLALNVLWSAFFFGLRNIFLGFAVIVLLWAAILLTMAFFRLVSGTAAYLLIPYLLWVSFAAVLNFSILRLN